MSYGIDNSTKESNVPSSINAGIQENVSITGVTFDTMTEGQDPLIQVNFEDDYGNTLQEILWPVDEEREKQWFEPGNKHKRDNKSLGFVEGEKITLQDKILQAYELFNQRAKHIAKRVASDEVITETMEGAGSYKEFGEAFASIFTESRLANAPKLRAKVVLNNKDYSKLPKFPPFLESMEVPADKSKLEINPQYDRITKADVNEDSDDPLGVADDAAALPDSPDF